jgi:nucleoside-diphosphate-sugar epimerase
MTSSTHIITVFGATGNQGGAVARSLLKNPSFKVRALTRNPSSAASQALAAQGAQIHQANGFSSESMVEAFRGSWGAFVNINSDDKVCQWLSFLWRCVRLSLAHKCFSIQAFKLDGLTEFGMGKTIVDAAAHAGVRHFIFSTGPDCYKLTGGKIKMNAADSV